jgi:hypothetical protein
MVNKSKGITLSIIKKTEVTTPTVEKTDCTKEENKDNSLCKIPNFVGKTINDVNLWQNKLASNSIVIYKKSKDTNNEDDDKKVIDQTDSSIGQYIYDLSSRTITIEYYEYKDPIDILLP